MCRGGRHKPVFVCVCGQASARINMAECMRRHTHAHTRDNI